MTTIQYQIILEPENKVLCTKNAKHTQPLVRSLIFMNDKEKFETLFAVCRSLAEAGQTPSVGILRGKAPFKVSVLEAIEVIKRFNQHQQLEAEKPAPKALSDKERIVELEARVSQLEQAIGVMEARLAKLDV